MRLVTAVQIKGFRSLQNESLESLGSLTSLVGKNSSGKSNLLRALNLFFNGEVEPGKPLLLQRDFHSRPAARRKKEISVTVDFVLPPSFKFRQGLQALKTAIGDEFSITKRWELNSQKETVALTELTRNGRKIGNGDSLARQFLTLVTFRYIPNRTVPAALLREESRVISDTIFARIRGDSGASELMEAMRTAADGLLAPASRSMTNAGTPLSDVAIASATSLAEMLSVTGFQAKGVQGNIVRDEEWGAGNQAFFLYEILQAVDTNNSRTFGWKQFTIWGVEEPESGLHRDLETRLADEFRNWTSDGKTKLQIVQTTHSPIFTMAADVGFWVELSDGSSTVTNQPIPELVRDAERKGVSGWVQPILAFPTNPVILVEGTHDVDVLTHVANLVGLDRLRFLALPDLDAAEKGRGKDAIGTYLKRHSGLLANRPKQSPLLVLLDWEVSNQEITNARQAYGPDGNIAVLRMDSSHCNGHVGSDFKGIERFYPPSVIRDAANAGECLVGDDGNQPISISATQLNAAKHKLKARILGISSSNQLPELVAVVRQVETAVASLAART